MGGEQRQTKKFPQGRAVRMVRRRLAWIGSFPSRLLPVALVAWGSLFGCAGAADADAPGENTGSVSQAIYAGMTDSDEGDNTAVVALKIGDQAPFDLCTGALIAPNLVLTARHCISIPVTSSVSCNEDGASGNGAHVGADRAPSSIRVYVGAHPNLGGEPDAQGQEVFHPGGNVLCNGDIAVLALDRPITDIAPMRVRVRAGALAGETVRAVGYGRNDLDLPSGTRLQKPGVKVLAMGRTVSASQTPLASREFEVGLSSCRGDSGGPAISETTGAVIGVVSRGTSCTQDYGHTYTTTAGFDDVLSRAFRYADHTMLEEIGGPTQKLQTQSEVYAGQIAADEADMTQGQGCSAAAAPKKNRLAGWLSLGCVGLLVGARARRRSRR